MNHIVEEMRSYIGLANRLAILEHEGVSILDGAPGPGSGRYPLGSGERPHQHDGGDFTVRVQQMRAEGYKDPDIAKALGFRSSQDLRINYSIAQNEKKNARYTKAVNMLNTGHSRNEVQKELGISESTLRSILKAGDDAKSLASRTTADSLKALVDEKGMINVSKGAEKELNVSNDKLQQALELCRREDYPTYKVRVRNITNKDKYTTITVLCPPGTPYKDAYDFNKVNSIKDYTIRQDDDGNESLQPTFRYPESLDPNRLKIRYRDEVGPDGHTGVERDGTIEIRRGLADLDLKGSNYAQVRIRVGEDRYLKGMANYSDNLPDGVDVLFNTNKTPETGDWRNVLKPMKSDPENPFGSLLREEGGQYEYTDPNTGEKKLGLINKTRQEGDWGEWSKTLPSQFLAKQTPKLIETQLKATTESRQKEFDEIMTVTNPVVKEKLLTDFANQCDKSSVHLEAASLPRQAYQVLLPVPTLKDNEVYAPNYHDGETVALVRFPHAGRFELVLATVNNKSQQGIEMMGKHPRDAVGVNSRTLGILSGADCDGDTALIIPCNSEGGPKIENHPPLKGLMDFDPTMNYGPSKTTVDADGTEHYYRGDKEYKVFNKTMEQRLMGEVSNLIMDMTLKGAPEEDLVKAVRHSMVVIDAYKHHLDYKQSFIDNDIADLKKTYQEHIKDEETGKMGYGASTLITRAKSEKRVDKPVGTPLINQKGKSWYDPNRPEGSLIYKYKTNDKDKPWYDPDQPEGIRLKETYVDKNGKVVERQKKSTQMAETDDAYSLVSDFRTAPELLYADYANEMKDLANRARLESTRTGEIKYSKAAYLAYKEEADKLKEDLRVAEANKPREQLAQLAANGEMKALLKEYPELYNDKKERGKRENSALARARVRYGSKRVKIEITPRQWEAIQAGAINKTTLRGVLQYADPDVVRDYATPGRVSKLSSAQITRIKSLMNSNVAPSVIAEQFGVSTTTLYRIIDENAA